MSVTLTISASKTSRNAATEVYFRCRIFVQYMIAFFSPANCEMCIRHRARQHFSEKVKMDGKWYYDNAGLRLDVEKLISGVVTTCCRSSGVPALRTLSSQLRQKPRYSSMHDAAFVLPVDDPRPEFRPV